jgi:D-glycero-alpha-D-manno-heptose-7-phosphate kinase
VIAVRAPLRVSLGGGGTDLPSYFAEEEGFVLSAAIDKHVWLLVSTGFQEGIRLKHLAWEEVADPADVEHPILRVALGEHWNGDPLELASMADVPAGTGLGSSGAYAVCAVRALSGLAGAELAEAACRLEIDLLGRTVGKQDQYAAVHGGINALTFHPDSVAVRPLSLPAESSDALRERFLLFFTGGSRSASRVLSDQVNRTLAGDPEVRDNLRRTGALARDTAAALEAGDLAACGELMNRSWETKRARAAGVVPAALADLRDLALSSGGTGAMLMGAGGGGFLLVLADDPTRLRAAMSDAGTPELPFDLDRAGCVSLGA